MPKNGVMSLPLQGSCSIVMLVLCEAVEYGIMRQNALIGCEVIATFDL